MPASPTCVSCSPLPPLTPMPPTTSPSTSMGKPPTKIANLPGCMAWMPKASLPGSAGPPGGALNLWVARRWPAAVKALAMAISTPVRRAPVIRWRAMGCPPSSQTQMVSATPISLALASAASRTMRASSSVSRLTVIIRAASRDAGSRHVHPYTPTLDPHGGPSRGTPSPLSSGSASHLFLQHEGAVEAAHVLPGHLGRLPPLLGGLGVPLGRGAVSLDDLVAALAVDLVRLDVDGEELDPTGPPKTAHRFSLLREPPTPL